MTVLIVLDVVLGLAAGWYWSATRTARRDLAEREQAIARLVEENRLLRRGSRP